MTLEDYKEKHGLTLPQLAEKLGIPYTTLCSYYYHHRRPSLDRLLQIERATKGEVTIHDFQKAS